MDLIGEDMEISKVETETGSFFGEIFGFNTDETFDEVIKSIPLKLFFDYDAKDMIVADVGCGFGRTSYEFLLAGAKKVLAIDFSSKQLERTRRNCLRHSQDVNRLQTIQDSATTLEMIPNNSCDIIVSLGVIHHLPDFDRGLETLCRIAAPGGTIFFATLGKKGVVPFLRRLIRLLTKPIPYRFADPLLKTLPLSNGWKYTIADICWSPVYHMRSLKELDMEFQKYGCKIVEVADIYKNKSAIFRLLNGEGFLHVRAIKEK